nr:hypothetical protein JVH1_8762 [Rhodococcus sp. JVH1]
MATDRTMTADCLGGGSIADGVRAGRVAYRVVLMLDLGSLAERRGASAWPETVAAGRSVARS